MKEWTRPFCTSDTLAQLFYDIMGDLALGKSFEFKQENDEGYKTVPKEIAGSFNSMYPVCLMQQHS
jgi:hypothetical protein